jgi:hypothetical protein
VGWLTAIKDWLYEPQPQVAVMALAEAPPTLALIEATPSLPEKARGSDGVIAYGGYLMSGEKDSKLIGQQKWITYANAMNAAIVATGVRYFGNLLAGTEWHVEPNPAGGAAADRGVEIVEQGLIGAEMSKPWSSVVRKAAMYRLYGFSLHAAAVRRRADGMIVFSDLAHRPQWSIEQWLRPDEQSAWESVRQRTMSGEFFPIPLSECLYCVDDTLTDSPEGVGLLRHVIQLVNRLDRYQVLEWLAYEGDMAGIPIGRAPLELLKDAAGTSDAVAQAATVAAATNTLKGVIENRIKTPEALQYLLLDSATYVAAQTGQISPIQKWGLDILKGNTNGLPQINEVIKRLQFEIARVLGIEFALVGAEGGSYAMHEDKTSMFATSLSVTLAEMGNFATNQLARRLVALNGLDPDVATPKLCAEPISTDKVEATAKSLYLLQLAKLHPLDPAGAVIRERLRLPPIDPATLPALIKAWEEQASKPAAAPAQHPTSGGA